MGDDVDISALTIEQYLALIQDNNRLGIVKPKIGDDVKFKINSNFMRELRRKLFVETDDKDAHEHAHGVLEIVDLFHFRGITHDAIMLRVFLITLKGRALRDPQFQTRDVRDSVSSLGKTVLTNTEEKFKARTTIGKENIKEPVPCDLPPTPFLGHLKEQIGIPYRTRETICMIENLGEVHKIKAQEDEGDMDVGWDITVKDAERLRKFLTPTIHTLPNPEFVVQPYIPLGPVYDMEKIVREKEQEYDIPLHDGVMQPLAP
nr:hypothetical protein [Tanacetum cinerariifolium]GEX74971.1 hypothetical protein [Tanacetum cinerariifolium]